MDLARLPALEKAPKETARGAGGRAHGRTSPGPAEDLWRHIREAYETGSALSTQDLHAIAEALLEAGARVMIGDIDGVVILPFDRIDAVIARLETVRKAEAELDAKVKAGLEVPDFIQGLLNSDRVREID